MDYSLKRMRADAFTKEEVVEALKRVAKEFNGQSFSTRDFDRKSGLCSHQVPLRIFGTWARALAEVGVTYRKKGKVPPNKIPDIELFNEMERIWKTLGHRPSRQELQRTGGKYSYKAYSERFGGWVAACRKFIEYKSGQYEILAQSPTPGGKVPIAKEKENKIGARTIPLKLRFRVMDRDGYRCVVCGRSPATDIGIILHIDHILAYSKGGQATEENLRTLCQNCNWGKGKD